MHLDFVVRTMNFLRTMNFVVMGLYSFFLSRVSHKGEFYLDKFLMRQPLHSSSNVKFLFGQFRVYL